MKGLALLSVMLNLWAGAALATEPPASAEAAGEPFVTYQYGKRRNTGFAKYEVPVGDFATITRKHGVQSGLTRKSTKWRLFHSTPGRNDSAMSGKVQMVVKSGHGVVNLEGEGLVIYHPFEEPDQSIPAFLIEYHTGISDVGPPSPIDTELGGTLTSSLVPGESWRLSIMKTYRPGAPIDRRGQLAGNQRVIEFSTLPPDPAAPWKTVIEAREDGNLLCRSEGNELSLRRDLSPQVKMFLLAGIEELRGDLR